MSTPPTDSYQRRIDYLRVSVTDRCNLRCTYCMPADGVPKLDHSEILRYEEILRLVRIAARTGITKIRVTGGEPLVRKDILYLCETISHIPEVESLSITTNGVLLERFAEDLVRVGVKRINISLDTLKPEKYALITREDRFHEVWRGIEAAREAGLTPIKLNAVAMRGVNDDEIEDLARLTFEYPFHVRFIEFMPFGEEECTSSFISADEIVARLSRVAPLMPAETRNGNGPARHYRFSGAKGKIGIISPVSHHFCSTCNRLRLTADGKLRTCLFSTEETDMKTLIRQGLLDDDLFATLRKAISQKPEKHQLVSGSLRKCVNRPMVAIGG
jgi:GTP 3',8-cyclase